MRTAHAPILDPSLVAVGPELTWLAERGLVIRLPDEPLPPASDGRAVLHILAPGTPPPPCGPFEDWIRLPIDRDDLIVRADRLLDRASDRPCPTIEVDDGVLRVGDLAELISPQEERLISALLEAPGQLVSREHLVRAVWPEGAPADPRALDNRVKAIRRRLEHVPLRIHTVRGRGLLLELTDRG